MLGFADIRHVAVADGAGGRLAQDLHRFVWSQDVTHQISEGAGADHLVRTYVVSLAGPAVLQQGEEPMGQVSLVEECAQGGAVAGDGDGIGRESIADEITDGEVYIERQVGAHESKAACHYGFQAMLLPHESAEVFSGSLGLSVGRAGFGQGRTAGPVFRDGWDISGLGAVDGAGAGKEEAHGACGNSQIKDVAGAIHDLVITLQRSKARAVCRICRGVEHMGKALITRE